MRRGGGVARLAAALLVAIGWPATAGAEPDPATEPGAAAAAPPVGLAQFGRPETLELRDGDAAATVTIPVPIGMTVTTVSGRIGSAVNLTTGRIDVLDGRGNAIDSIGLDADRPTAAFVVDTAAATPDDGLITLNFFLRTANPPSDTCAPTPSATLTGLAATMAGRPPDPSTVADFLPAHLDAVTISTGPNPTPDQQQAALTLTAMLTRSYRPIPLQVDVDTSDRTPLGGNGSAGAGVRRVIVIRENAEGGIVVRSPGTPEAVLEISGRGPQLADQIAMFIDRRLTLAQTASATIRSAAGLVTPTSSIMTFEQLGIANSASFTGSTTMYTGFDGAAFAAGPIVSATVDLRARYTPVADDKASVLVKAGTSVVATRRLDQSGVLELRFDVPPQTIASDVGMALELQYFPAGGRGGGCAPLTDRMTFALDPQSTVEVNPGPAGAGGFRALPAGFTPEFAVAVERPDLIRYAAAAVNLISQRTATLLRPQLAGLDEAAASEMPVLAVTAGRDLADLGMQPPIRTGRDGQVEVDGSADTGALIDGPLGLVQSFTDDGRTVLEIEVPARPELTDATVAYIRGLDNGWSSLTGDVVATGAAWDTVNLTVRADRPVPGRSPSKPEWKWAALASLGVGAATAVVISRRRARR